MSKYSFVLILLVVVLAIAAGGCCLTAKTGDTSIQYDPPKRTIEEIWEIEDQTDFVTAMLGHILEKCRYGDDMDKLSAPERVFFVTTLLEGEVNNGGFSQFFFNSSGDYANELVDAFTEIGAIKTAEICKKAVSVYGEYVPTGRAEREDLLLDNDAVEEILDECDNAFYEYEDDLITLYCEYIVNHKEHFT